jgi:hypothetical protein
MLPAGTSAAVAVSKKKMKTAFFLVLQQKNKTR